MISWDVETSRLGPQAQAAFASLDSVYALQGVELSRSLVSDVIRLTLDGERYYVKRYRAGRRNALRGRLGMTRIEREWANLRRFEAWGIAAAHIVACGLERRHRRFQRGAMITVEIRDSTDLATLAKSGEFARRDRAWLQAILQQVAADTRTIHSRRFAHNDLKWRNILITAATPPKTFWIDCPDGMFWWGPFLRYRIIKDLACLDKLGRVYLSRTQRLRFYLDYVQQPRLSRADKQRIGKILAFFEGRD